MPGLPTVTPAFVLSLEPLAQAIRQHKNISPISICGSEQTLYADDVLLFRFKVETSLPHVLELFSYFKNLSGYKINWTKSTIMPLNNGARNTQLPSFLPTSTCFTYLGIRIHPSLKNIVRDNFLSLLLKIKEDLKRWSTLTILSRQNHNN